MKNAIRNTLIGLLLSIIALGFQFYIIGSGGVALDENMTLEAYFNIVVNFQWLLFFVIVLIIFMNLVNLYLIIKKTDQKN